MVCFYMLIGKEPFFDLKSPIDAKRKIKNGDWPFLPNHCPPILKNVIEVCWKLNGQDRPTFVEICKELRHVQYDIMTSLPNEMTLENNFHQNIQFQQTTNSLSKNLSKISLVLKTIETM